MIKEFTGKEGSAITLTYNEIKDIIKVVKPLENRRIFFKGTTEIAVSQKEGLLASLMRIGLLLMKNVLTQLPKNVLLPTGVTAAVSATDAANQS